jgi:type IV pilus assembly protein PilA
MDCNIFWDCKIFGLRGRAHGTHKGTLSAPNGFTPPNGFTLMELLIVIAIILILMLMAIPTIGVMKKHANDTSAINSLRAITQAEIQYESTYPAQGYACSLASLGGDPNSGPPTPQASQLIQSDLASGFKSGYIFNVTNCTKVTVNNQDRVTGYTLTAVPQAVGKTGDRGFCTDQFGGSPKYDPTGGTNCTQLLQ